jgi:transketolase
MESQAHTISGLKASASRIRRRILDIALAITPANVHIAPSLSMTDILAVLYGAVIRVDPKNTRWPDRDRFILSKGHAAVGYYAVLAEAGFLTDEDLQTYAKPESDLTGHPVLCMDKGIEYTTGSLGQGLSVGVGLALAARKTNRAYKTYVLLGDGECNEGSVWEAVMVAAHLRLSDLTAIVDVNRMQSDGRSENILDMGSHEEKWHSFGWDVFSVDGHDAAQLLDAFTAPAKEPGRPRAIIAKTVKGKGVSFMEHNNEWHHSRITKAQHEAAMVELAD